MDAKRKFGTLWPLFFTMEFPLYVIAPFVFSSPYHWILGFIGMSVYVLALASIIIDWEFTEMRISKIIAAMFWNPQKKTRKRA